MCSLKYNNDCLVLPNDLKNVSNHKKVISKCAESANSIKKCRKYLPTISSLKVRKFKAFYRSIPYKTEQKGMDIIVSGTE